MCLDILLQSYSKVRRFLTSAALYMSTSQLRTQLKAIVPTNVKSGENSGTLIVSVADNMNHNEHTMWNTNDSCYDKYSW